jgi:Cytidylyltransferase-like
MMAALSFDPWSSLLATGLGGLIVLTVKLVWPIVIPEIITYPWPTNAASAAEQQRDRRTIVAFCGSFNPPHNGHLAMMIYLAER